MPEIGLVHSARVVRQLAEASRSHATLLPDALFDAYVHTSCLVNRVRDWGKGLAGGTGSHGSSPNCHTS